MKISSVILRDKVPSLSVQQITVEKNNVDMSFDAGIVTIVRLQYPEEPAHLVPVSNIVEMRAMPPVVEKPRRKSPANEPILEPVPKP